MTSLIVHASHLPQPRQQMDFLDSTFFRAFPKQTLPTPAEIRAMSGSKSSKPPPVFIQHLGTVVKFGNFVNVAEAQSLWLVGTRLGHCVPVPEVYGWRTDKGEVFSYMRYINSATLSERWTYLSMEEKTSFCEQLSRMVSYIRQIKQAPTDPFIGTHYKRNSHNFKYHNYPIRARVRKPPSSAGLYLPGNARRGAILKHTVIPGLVFRFTTTIFIRSEIRGPSSSVAARPWGNHLHTC
jgi:hypothetical protein